MRRGGTRSPALTLLVAVDLGLNWTAPRRANEEKGRFSKKKRRFLKFFA